MIFTIRRDIVFFFMGMISFTLQAQTTELSGRILGDRGKELPYATVIITDANNPKNVKTTTSTEKGRFLVKVKPSTSYLLTCSYMGYQTHTAPIATDNSLVQELGDIHLKMASHQLEEVVVKPLVTVDVDALTYNIEADPNRSTSNMLQILEKVPLIQFSNRGVIQVGEEGSSSYIVLRNGREDALFNTQNVPLKELLSRLPAMGFSSIRVINNPPLKYKNYKYVVDIITDKSNPLIGYVAQVTHSTSLQDYSIKPQLGSNASISSKLRFSANANYNRNYGTENTSHRTTNTFSTSTLLDEFFKENRTEQNYSGSLMCSYDLPGKNFFTVSTSYADGRRCYTTNGLSSTFNSGVLDKNIATNAVSRISTASFTGTMSYDWLSQNELRSLNVSYLAANNPILKKYNRIFDDRGKDSVNSNFTREKELLFQQRAQLYYYDLQNKKIQFYGNLGYQNLRYSQNLRMVSGKDGLPTENNLLYRTMERVDNSVDGFVSVNLRAIARLSLSIRAGGSYLFKNNRSTMNVDTLVLPISRSGLTYSGEVGIRYMFNKSKNGTIRVDYSLSQALPNVEQLYYFENPVSPNYIKVGNKNLQPEQFQTINLTVLYRRYYLPNIQFSFSNNKISRVWQRNGVGQTVESLENSGKFRNITLFFGAKKIQFKRVGSFIKPSLAYTTEQTASGQKTKRLNWDINVDNGFTIYKKVNIDLEMHYRDWWSSGYASYGKPNPFSLKIGISYNIEKGTVPIWSFNVSCDPLQWTGKTTSHVKNADYEMWHSSSYRSVPLLFSIKYCFGNFKSKPPRSSSRTNQIQGYSSGGL